MAPQKPKGCGSRERNERIDEGIDMTLEDFAAILISIIALVMSVLTYFYRTSPSLAVRFDKQIFQAGALMTLNYGGKDPLGPGEAYLDMVLLNGGPGVARNLKWEIEIRGFAEGEDGLKGELPILEPYGKVVVQSYLKIYHDNLSRARDSFKQKNSIPQGADLTNEQLGVVVQESVLIEKYLIHISYQSFLTNKSNLITLSFNENGGYIIKKEDGQTSGVSDTERIPDLSAISRLPILLVGASNLGIAIMTIIGGIYSNAPFFFGWLAKLVIFLNAILGIALLSAYPNKGLKRWVNMVRKCAKAEWIRHESSTFVFMLLLGSIGIAVGLSNITVGLARFDYTWTELLKLVGVVILSIMAIALGFLSSNLPKKSITKETTNTGFFIKSALLTSIIISAFALVLYEARVFLGPMFYITIVALLVSLFLGSDALSREFPRTREENS